MTDNQLAALFCALPFLTLAIAWGVGLSLLIPRPHPVRVKRNRRPE